MVLTFLAYTGDDLILERSVETECAQFEQLAIDLREELNCHRVIIINGDEFAFDTNDIGTNESRH